MKFGDRLRELRTLLGLTQSQLGEKFNLAESTISLYEKNKRFPDQETLIKIADFFDVPLDYLLGRDTREPATIKNFKNEMGDLPAEALRSIEEYKELMKIKYSKKPAR